MPAVEVLEAACADKAVVQRLIELYSYDFSEFTDADVDEHALFGYRYLDDYWTDADRHPYLFRVDGRWAGFALVRAGAPHDMAEFFVMRKYRRHAVGITTARDVFARFPGAWQVRQVAANAVASAFWRRAIPVEFDEETDEHGRVQRFSIPA